MNYQGVTTRHDVVASLCVLWFLVTYYPNLSLGLIVVFFISTFWENAYNGTKVVVNMFRGIGKGKKSGSKKGEKLAKNITLTQAIIDPDDAPAANKNFNEEV